MHNCRETKERLTELALDEAMLPAELGQCDECRTEFEALNATLRVTARLRETVAPSEDYWIDYHARLRERIFHAKAQRSKEEFAPLFAPLRLCLNLLLRFLKFSVPVPVPLAIAGIILLGVIATRKSPAPNPVVVHVPVEVPVVQEKTITQVVYRDRRPTSKPSKRASLAPTAENTFANLAGFKPADEVKLTVIKGGISNEN
jgi:hypothetical protein